MVERLGLAHPGAGALHLFRWAEWSMFPVPVFTDDDNETQVREFFVAPLLSQLGFHEADIETEFNILPLRWYPQALARGLRHQYLQRVRSPTEPHRGGGEATNNCH